MPRVLTMLMFVVSCLPRLSMPKMIQCAFLICLTSMTVLHLTGTSGQMLLGRLGAELIFTGHDYS